MRSLARQVRASSGRGVSCEGGLKERMFSFVAVVVSRNAESSQIH